jgi:hypothetical protein
LTTQNNNNAGMYTITTDLDFSNAKKGSMQNVIRDSEQLREQVKDLETNL